MELGGSLLLSEEPATSLYPEAGEISPHLRIPPRVVGSQDIEWETGQSRNSMGAVVVVLVALAIATDLA
jgi:hypothetical protein